MAEIVIVNSAKTAADNTIQLFYTSPATGAGTRISAFTASNNTASSKTYRGYIYDASAAAFAAVIPQKIIVPDRFDLGASIVGQIIPPGGTLRMETNIADSIAFRVTGVEL
jgi:hypothetical protein